MPRVFNQDPIEHFFEQLRQHSSRDTNPTAAALQNAFRILLINNFVSCHSLAANCEDEESYNIATVENLVAQRITSNENEIFPIISDICYHRQKTFVNKITIGYVAGFIAKNIRKFFLAILASPMYYA